MFWPILAVAAGALGFIQLGALAVKVVVLKALLAVTVVVSLLLGLLLAWRSYRK